MSAALDDLYEFLDGPNALLVGTRDAANVPAITRPIACALSADKRRVTIFLADDAEDRAIANLRENGRVALVLSRPTTYETYQLTGADAKLEPATDADCAFIADFRARQIAEMMRVGLSHEVADQVVPALKNCFLGVSFTPDAVYRQTPGPGAGERHGN